MARQRCENREKAKALFLESDGLMKNPEIAEMLGVDPARVRKWKCEDKWKEALQNKPKHRGGPKGNKNAETHGAYSRVNYENLSDEEKERIENLTLDSKDNMLWELRNLMAKEQDLMRRIAEYNDNGEKLFTDKVVEMRAPGKEPEAPDGYGTYREPEEKEEKKKLNLAMETTVKSSAFERSMKLEAELNKTRGRIIKILDSIKSYELEQRRIELEERRYTLLKQKLSGAFEVDVETGEIDDTYREEDDGGIDELEE